MRKYDDNRKYVKKRFRIKNRVIMKTIVILKTREYKGKIIENYELLEENMKEKRKYYKNRANITRIKKN